MLPASPPGRMRGPSRSARRTPHRICRHAVADGPVGPEAVVARPHGLGRLVPGRGCVPGGARGGTARSWACRGAALRPRCRGSRRPSPRRAPRRARLPMRRAPRLRAGCHGRRGTWPPGHASARACRLGGGGDEPRPHAVPNAPAHHHARARAARDGEIYEACRGPGTGRAAHGPGCRGGTREVPPDGAGAPGGVRCGQRRPPRRFGAGAADARPGHAPPHAVAGRHCESGAPRVARGPGPCLPEAGAPAALPPYRADGPLEGTPGTLTASGLGPSVGAGPARPRRAPSWRRRGSPPPPA